MVKRWWWHSDKVSVDGGECDERCGWDVNAEEDADVRCISQGSGPDESSRIQSSQQGRQASKQGWMRDRIGGESQVGAEVEMMAKR